MNLSEVSRSGCGSACLGSRDVEERADQRAANSGDLRAMNGNVGNDWGLIWCSSLKEDRPLLYTPLFHRCMFARLDRLDPFSESFVSQRFSLRAQTLSCAQLSRLRQSQIGGI